MWKPNNSRIVVCLAIAAAAAAWAQEPTLTEIVDLEGKVVNSVTGEPIAGASVVLTPGFDVPKMTNPGEMDRFMKKVDAIIKGPRREELSTTTDASGKFTFHSNLGMGWSLNVSHSNYRAPRSDSDIAHFQGPPSLKADPVVVKLDPLGVIEGKVLNEDGDPVPGISVELIKVEIPDGRRNLRRYANKVTDDQGAYRLWHLSPGSYYLRISGAAPAGQSGLTYGPFYYPSSLDLDGAQLVRVAPGVTMQADLNVAARPAFHVRGKFADSPANRPVSMRLLRGEEEIGNRYTTSPSAGTFELFDVTPGNYTLQATSIVPGEALFGETPITIRDRDVEGVMVNLSPPASVAGSFEVVANSPLTFITANYSNPRHLPPGLSPMAGASSDKDGKFVLGNLWPGHYTITPRSKGTDKYVRAISSGSIDVLANGLTITAGTVAIEPLRIQYGDGAAATIKPKLAESLPDAETVAVALVPKAGTPGELSILHMPGVVMPKLPKAELTERPEFKNAMAHLSSLVFSDLAPGDYLVYAWRNGQQVEYRNPAVLASLSTNAVAVTVAAGDSKEITLKILPRTDPQ